MQSIFNTFNPDSFMMMPFGWVSVISPLFLVPMVFWKLAPLPGQAWKSLSGEVHKELSSSFNLKSLKSLSFLLIGVFTILLSNNLLGLFPYVFTGTSHLVYSLSMALPLWIGHMALAMWQTKDSTLAHLVPLGTPGPLAPFMVLIELVSSLIRPLTLAVRLAANMVAGHLLLTLLGGPTPNANLLTLSMILVCAIALLALESAVAAIQAYVFTLLNSLYLEEVNPVSTGKAMNPNMKQ